MKRGRHDPKLVVKRAKKSWKNRNKWTNLWQDVYDYMLPNQDPFNESSGSDMTEKIYDSTPVTSAKRFASRMQTELTPPFERWFELQSGPIVQDSEEQLQDQLLEHMAKVSNQVFASGNFNTAVHEYYKDLGIGTGCMLVLEAREPDMTQPIKFVTIPQHQVAFREGPFNEIDQVYRKPEMTARDIQKRWPNAELPDKIKEDLEDEEKEDNEHALWEATYEGHRERDVVREGPQGEEMDVTIQERVWFYELIWDEESEEKPERIHEEVFLTNPWIITRWDKNPGEVRGRGPFLTALPDVKTLNKAKEMVLKNASLSIASPLMVADDGVTSPDNIRIAPAALIPVARNAGPNGPSIAPLETSRNFDLSQIVMEDLRQDIKKMLFNEQLPPLDQGTPRSATEIVQRMRELVEDIGGSFGRLYLEFIEPLVQRVLHILFQRGVLDQQIDLKDLGVKLKVTSPLAQSQNINEVQQIVRWLQLVQSFGGPQALALNTKMEDVFQSLAKKLGVPARLIRTQQEKQEIVNRIGNIVQQGLQQQGLSPEGTAPTGEVPGPEQLNEGQFPQAA